MMYAVKYRLPIWTKNVYCFQFAKSMATPFMPKTGDSFWIEGPPSGGVVATAGKVYFNLTTGEMDVDLGTEGSDWTDCDPDEMPQISAVLLLQGWVIAK